MENKEPLPGLKQSATSALLKLVECIAHFEALTL